MSEQRDDGGSAFPARGYESPGMSLRDWFAGQALTGIWAQIAGTKPSELGCKIGEVPERLARAAYKQADAMLKERAK